MPNNALILIGVREILCQLFYPSFRVDVIFVRLVIDTILWTSPPQVGSFVRGPALHKISTLSYAHAYPQEMGNDEPIGQAAGPAVQLGVAVSVTTDGDCTMGAELASGAVFVSTRL